MNDDLLKVLLGKLDEPLARYTTLDAYYNGTQPLAFLTSEARTAIGTRFSRMATNLPRLAVASLAERLKITSFTVDGQHHRQLWADWTSNGLDELSKVAHREALVYGECPVIVWANKAGKPQVTIESPLQVSVVRDPATREVVAALKRWQTDTTTEVSLFEADKVTRLRANQLGATTTGFTTVAVEPNPFGTVPVVMLRNSDRLLGPGASEIDDLMPLVDALNKLLADMMVTSEFGARPRRWATGVEAVEDDDGNTVNPFPESNRMLLSESDQAKFGQLPGADMAGYENAINVVLGQVMAVSALPAHYVGIFTDNPASADALRAAEASLTARAENRQAVFGRAWEKVAALMVAVRTGINPTTVDPTIVWADAATRSRAQEADAAVKLYQAGILDRDQILQQLGYTAETLTQTPAKKLATQRNGVVL